MIEGLATSKDFRAIRGAVTLKPSWSKWLPMVREIFPRHSWRGHIEAFRACVPHEPMEYFRAIRGAVTLKHADGTRPLRLGFHFRAIRGAVTLKQSGRCGAVIKEGNISAPFVARSH